jgi:hypothetical protein
MTTLAVPRRLADVRLTDVSAVGGKAAGLGELLAIGARVPDGVVVGIDAAGPDADRKLALVESATTTLGDGPLAVRSSAIAEDGRERSFAGMFETVLDVSPPELPGAIERVLASARTERVAGYEPSAAGRMAVIVQRMVRPVAAGVALTADPISGDRSSCVVTAVRGLGDRLVSGAAAGDEWVVRDGRATVRRRPERAIDHRQAVQVATEARRIAGARGGPLDVEWAIDEAGELWILQARPMTALSPEVSWEPSASGAFTRQIRFGEWISEPVTPLFESWLLTMMEDRLHQRLLELVGQRAPRPHHVVVNGWYFYSLNWLSGASLLRSLPGMLWHLVRTPRHMAGIIPPTVRHSIPITERLWREDVLPRYRAATAEAEAEIETLPVEDLPELIDRLAGLAGEYFTSVAAFAGAAYKMEINLARFYRRHLARSLGGSHLLLLAGFEPPPPPDRHAVTSLDWWHVPGASASAQPAKSERHDEVVARRIDAEREAFDALAGSPRRLRAFRDLLAETQRLVPIREEHVRELTLPWPVMRRAVVRIGEVLAARGVIDTSEDVFFLSRSEALRALEGGGLPADTDPGDRRSRRDEQARLVPPLLVGRINPALKRLWDQFPRMVGAVPSETAIVSGSPASPGEPPATCASSVAPSSSMRSRRARSWWHR